MYKSYTFGENNILYKDSELLTFTLAHAIIELFNKTFLVKLSVLVPKLRDCGKKKNSCHKDTKKHKV